MTQPKTKSTRLPSIFTQIYQSLPAFIGSNTFLILVYCWFATQAIYMAFSTGYGIPPDEVYHFSFIKLFASNGWSPFLHNEQGYFFLGEVIKTPFFLYHYMLSIPLHFFISSSHAFIYTRLINILFGLFSLIIANRIATQLKIPPTVKNLSLFMLVNTLMFVFLSASVNYDNLFVLFSLASISVLLDLIDEFNMTSLLLLLNILVLGLLIKVSFIPMAISVGFIFLLKYTPWSLPSEITWKSWRTNKMVNVTLSCILVLATVLFVQRYLINAVTYHSFAPSCSKVHTAAQCSQSALFKRDRAILHPQNTGGTDSLLYASQWIALMSNWTFGILGNKHIEPTHLIRVWVRVLLLLVPIATIRYYNPKNKKINIVLGIVAFYAAVLIFTNYRSFTHSGLVFLAVQGRYMFGLLPIIYIFSNYYVFKFLRKNSLQFTYILLTLIVFISAGLPSYIIATDSAWHTHSTVRLNENLHKDFVSARALLP